MRKIRRTGMRSANRRMQSDILTVVKVPVIIADAV
jgi:hypothetical protein